MAHYAFLDENNFVVQVFVGKDEGQDGIDWESKYAEIKGMVCKRTSYNTVLNKHQLGGVPFRKNFAGIGFFYDAERDAFISQKPFNSWFLNEQTCGWESPTPMPTDGKMYRWNEEELSWNEVAP